MACTAEHVLTLEVARGLVRRAGLETGSVLFDEDLVQDSLLRGIMAFGRTRTVKYPRAFFAKIVRDIVRDHWRRCREFEDLESVEHQAGPTESIEDQVDRKRQVARLNDALVRLPSQQLQLFHLFYFDGLKIGQISEVLGKSRSATKMSLLRGRRELARIVSL